MATYLTPDEIAEQYLLHLKTLKPEVNIGQTDSDWWVRSRVVGGVVSGVYADQAKIANDPFPQSARREGLEKSLKTYFDEGFKPATQAVGNVLITGVIGSIVPVGLQLEYEPNGNLYSVTEEKVIGGGGNVLVPVRSVAVGQEQNLLSGVPLRLPSPPAGVDNSGLVSGAISDGRNVESNEQAAARLLTQIRSPLAGGREDDYVQFAKNADAAVTDARVLRWPYGFGTVGVIITAGTTDIDQAIDNDLPIVLIPSDALVDVVQAYIEEEAIVTDCVYVMKPTPLAVDVTVRVRFASGNVNTVISGQSITQGELVVREVKRAIYKTPPGGRKFGEQGYVVTSDIEELLDFNLSADPYTVGEKAQILVDRQVDNLGGVELNLEITGTQVAVPGTITVVEMT